MPDDRLKHMAFMADKEKRVMEQTRLFNDPRRKERLARQQGYDEGYEDGWNAAMRCLRNLN